MRRNFSPWLGYFLAVLFVALATWLKTLAEPNIVPQDVPILYFLAIVPTAIFLGMGPAILASILSLFAFDYFFVTPLYTVLDFSHVQNLPILAIFLFVGILFSYLTSSLRGENIKANKEIVVRKEKEAELEKLKENLELQVKSRTKELEDALQIARNERSLLKTVMNCAGESHLVFLDKDFNFLLVNETYAKTCGYKPEEMIGKNHFLLYPNRENEAIFTEVRNTGIPVSYRDKPFEFPDQPERGITYWDWTLVPIKSRDGEVEGLVFSLTETTNRKKVEQRLESFNQELERGVNERTVELIEANDAILVQLALRTQAEESLRSLSSRLLNIQEEERRLIAKELHDEVGQNLTVLKLLLGRANRNVPDEVRILLESASTTVTDLIKEVRALSMSLRPGVLDELGLVAGLDSLFKQINNLAGLAIHFEHEKFDNLPQDISLVAYRIIQEALTNIMRHASVKEASVTIGLSEGQIILKIEDTGIGFDPSALQLNRSTGLSSMRERAALVGGTLKIESKLGKGTKVEASLPLSQK